MKRNIKTLTVVFCTALLIALGIGSAYAANLKNTLLVRNENGVRSYSTDDGKTWSQDLPEGVTVREEDGKITITNGAFPENGGEGSGMMVKTENGIRYYSTDGGRTWSENPPEGVTVDEAGIVFRKVKND